jgi:UrcA family protein
MRGIYRREQGDRSMNAHYASAALAALTLIAGPALAQSAQDNVGRKDDDARRMAVSYADLKLDTAAGQAQLMGRIHHAAEMVCGPSPDLHEVKAVMAFKRCMKQSVDTAVASIPSPNELASAIRPAG